jgi:membrane protease YdiL (CAAX protease family)
MSISPKTIAIASSFILFFIAIALEQVYDFIILNFSMPSLSYIAIYILIPCISLLAFGLLTKLTKSSFSKQGYKKPGGINTARCILLSIFFLVVYISVYLTQGFFGTLGPLNIPSGLYSLLTSLAISIAYALFSESVFRGYIFRNLTRHYGLFPSLYVSSILFSLYTISITDIATIAEDPFIFIFTNIIPLLASGLFLAFFFYKIRWSLLGPFVFRAGFLLFFELTPIGVSSPWWIALTFEMLAFAVLILLADLMIQEPEYRRRKYGLQE